MLTAWIRDLFVRKYQIMVQITVDSQTLFNVSVSKPVSQGLAEHATILN